MRQASSDNTNEGKPESSQPVEGEGEVAKHSAENHERKEALSDISDGSLNRRQNQILTDEKDERSQSLDDQIKKTGSASIGPITRQFGQSISIFETDEKGTVNELVKGRSKEEVTQALKELQDASDKGMLIGKGGQFTERLDIQEQLKQLAEASVSQGAPPELFANKQSETQIASPRLEEPRSHDKRENDNKGIFHQGYVSMMDNERSEADVLDDIKSSVSSASEAVAQLVQDSSKRVSAAFESAKAALGIAPSAIPPRPPLEPTGDFTSIPKGVQTPEDLAHVGIGQVAGYAAAINASMPYLTPGGINEALKSVGENIDQVLHPGPEQMVEFIKRQVDPIGTFKADLSTVGTALKDWASHRSVETFGQRGYDGGYFSNAISESGFAFLIAGKAMKSSEVAKALGISRRELEQLTKEQLEQLSRDRDVLLQRIEPINGQLPRNWKYAGTDFKFGSGSEFASSSYAREFPEIAAELNRKYPEGVHFSSEGFPDFEKYAYTFADGSKAITQIELQAKITDDFKLANSHFGWNETPAGFVWHHHQDAKTLLLVPRDLHQAIRHTGGRKTKIWKDGG